MRWVGKKTTIEFQSGTVAIKGYLQMESFPFKNTSFLFPLGTA